jgi:hypothetical protein
LFKAELAIGTHFAKNFGFVENFGFVGNFWVGDGFERYSYFGRNLAVDFQRMFANG